MSSETWNNSIQNGFYVRRNERYLWRRSWKWTRIGRWKIGRRKRSNHLWPSEMVIAKSRFSNERVPFEIQPKEPMQEPKRGFLAEFRTEVFSSTSICTSSSPYRFIGSFIIVLILAAQTPLNTKTRFNTLRIKSKRSKRPI